MEKPVITLYMNDPMGKWWLSITEAAGRAEKELGAQIKVIKKTSDEYRRVEDPPPCPSVMVNGKFIAKKENVKFEALKIAILSDVE